MARATAYCTCAKCNSSFKVVTTKANRREADSWEEWAQANITECDDCRAARVEAARAEAAKAAIAEASALGLPSLTGSEKQVKWAEQIRVDLVTTLQDYFDGFDWMDNIFLSDHPDKIKTVGQAMMHLLKAHTSAGWWIDNRSTASQGESIMALLRRTDWTAYREIMKFLDGDLEAISFLPNAPEENALGHRTLGLLLANDDLIDWLKENL